MNPYGKLLRGGFLAGVRKGLHGFVWMLKTVLPVSLFTAIVVWSGLFGRIDFLIQPVMSLFNLPAVAALPLMIGMLSSLYGAIAAMAVLPLTRGQMTLIALFLLIAHNLIQEGIIQGRSGIHPVKATLFRLITATVAVALIAPFLDTRASTSSAVVEASVLAPQSFLEMLKSWGITTSYLSLKIFTIIMSILTLLEIAKTLGWINHIIKILAPVLKILGLRSTVGILWVTAALFGIASGGAVIIEEVKDGHLPREDLEELHLSIGINHAMIEDPSIFLSLGLSPFWLWAPRVVMAIIAVRTLKLWYLFRKRHRL